MSLIIEEFKKIFKIKYLFTLIVILVFVGLIFTQVQIQNLHNRTERDQVGKYDYFKGTLTNEKYQEISTKVEFLTEKYPMGIEITDDFEELIDTSDKSMTGSDYEDKFVYISVLDEYHRLINFKQENILAIEKQQEKVEYLEALGLTKLASDLSKSIARYDGRQLTEYHYVDGIERFIQSDISILFSLTTLIYVCIRYIQIEKERKMELVINATYIGKRYHVLSKYIAMILFSFFIGILFELITFGTFWLFDLIKGLEAPIYQLKSFAYFPYNLTVFVSIILHILIKLTFISFCAVFIIFISSNHRKKISTLVIIVLALVLLSVGSFYQVMGGINYMKITQSILLIITTLLVPIVELFHRKRKEILND